MGNNEDIVFAWGGVCDIPHRIGGKVFGTIVDPHFSRAPPLDWRDSLLFGEDVVFGKVRVTTYFILF